MSHYGVVPEIIRGIRLHFSKRPPISNHKSNTNYENHPISSKPCSKSVGIFTDSLSNLSTLEKGISEAAEQSELFKIIDNLYFTMTFHHVKSHVGITHNEEVDALCNLKSMNPDRTIINSEGIRTKSQMNEWLKNWMRTERYKALLMSKSKTKDDKKSTKSYILTQNSCYAPI